MDAMGLFDGGWPCGSLRRREWGHGEAWAKPRNCHTDRNQGSWHTVRVNDTGVVRIHVEGKSRVIDAVHRHMGLYLVTDAKDVIVTPIANDIKVGGRIHLDLDLSRVCNGEEVVANVLRPSQGHAAVAEVKVRALQAVVANAVDNLLAEIAGGQMDGLSGTSAATIAMGWAWGRGRG